MSSTLGIIEVPSIPAHRMHHGSPAATLAARRFSGKSLLEWIVRRVADSLLLDQVAVVTDEFQADVVRKLAPSDVPVFACDRPDELGRFAAAANHFGAAELVRVPLACPFIDPELIDRLVCTAGANAGCDYIGFFSLDGRPAVLSKVGLFAEWCRASAASRADRDAVSPHERSEATRYIYSHPELFQLRFIPMPTKLDRPDVRLTVDVEEDWDLAQTVLDALGPEGLEWHRIAALLDQQPQLRERMAGLNHVRVTS
ncbi:MAG: NTP transferase domain-containing protein [Pirellulaceae bacterium]